MNRLMGSNLFGSMEILSFSWKELALIPGSGFTVNIISLIGPKISSTLPILLSLFKKIPALK